MMIPDTNCSLSIEPTPIYQIDVGTTGTRGSKGDTGDTVVTAQVGTTTTLPSGSSASVNNSGTDTELVLNFGIPKGEPRSPTREAS